MANIITSKFRSDSIRLLKDDMQNNDYYLFVSSISRTTAINSLDSKTEFLERTLFGKKLDFEDNFFYIIKNYPWQTGQVYDQYDDTVDMSDKLYYAVVYPENNSTGVYNVYKCLFNNYGSISTTPPNYNESVPDQIYNMSDGYIWKYMYSLSQFDFDKYATNGYIPITAENELLTPSNTAISTSDLEKIIVENNVSNNGYEKITGSVIESNVINVGGQNVYEKIFVVADINSNLSEFSNYYSGRTFYVKNNGSNSGKIYIIDNYDYNSITGIGEITLLGQPENDGHILKDISSFEILPRIEILGDGTGAQAITNIVNNTITSVTILNKGSGYTKAIARVIDPFGFDTTDDNRLDVRAILRPTLSTRNGHGVSLVDELSCRHCLLHAEMTELDNATATPTNTFSKIGIVKNPEFSEENVTIFDNRISVELESTQPITVNSVVDQIDENNQLSFEATVHEISANTVYLTDYYGPYPNQANTSYSLNPDSPIRSSQGDIIEINTDISDNPLITYPIYTPKTGEVYYMNDFFATLRTEDSRELFKIIIEF